MRMVALHIRSAIGDDGIAYSVRLIKGIVCEINYFIVNTARSSLWNTVSNSSGNPPLRIAEYKRLALGVDNGMFLLTHCAANHIRLSQRKARQTAENFYNLLLINNAAVGDLQNRTQQLVLITDF